MAIYIESSPTSARVTYSLDKIIAWRGKPAVVRGDDGLKDDGNTLIKWAIRIQSFKL